MKGYIEQVKRILVEMMEASNFGADRNGYPTLKGSTSGAVRRHWNGLARAAGSNFKIHSQEVKRKVLAKRTRRKPESAAVRVVCDNLAQEVERLRRENESLRAEIDRLRSSKVAPVAKERIPEGTEPETANTLVADIERQLSLGADRYVGWTLGQAKAALITGGKPRITVIRYVKKYGPKMRDNLGKRLLAWWGV